MSKAGIEKRDENKGGDQKRPAPDDLDTPTRKGPASSKTSDGRLVVRDPGLPEKQGLYDPANEQDACGVGFIADMKNRKSHAIVEQGLAILRNLDHRGAVGADPKMGDGCGILVQIPHRFFAEECAGAGIALPEPAATASGTCSCRATRSVSPSFAPPSRKQLPTRG
jgi:Glutamine amidotransferases class-II